MKTKSENTNPIGMGSGSGAQHASEQKVKVAEGRKNRDKIGGK